MRKALAVFGAAALVALPGAARADEASADAPCTVEPGTSNSVVVDCDGPFIGTADCYVRTDGVRISSPPITTDPPYVHFTANPDPGWGAGVHCPLA